MRIRSNLKVVPAVNDTDLSLMAGPPRESGFVLQLCQARSSLP